MKISLLLEREPFGKIFEESFTLFLNDFTKSQHKVKWHKKKLNIQNHKTQREKKCFHTKIL